jgi:hypothetical protein
MNEAQVDECKNQAPLIALRKPTLHQMLEEELRSSSRSNDY